MSTLDPGPNPSESAARRRLVLSLRALGVLSVVVSFASLWLSERTRVLDDLQLASEAAARPGEAIAMRAFYLRDIDAPEGPSLAVTDVRVRLLDAQEREVAQATLPVGRGDPSMEGRLQIPATARGAMTLEARAQLPGRAPRVCRRALDVRADAPMLVPREREAAPLALLSVGSLRPVPGAEALAAGLLLEPRVVGGTCLPEQPCRMLVWLGARAQLRVRHDAALRLARIAPSQESEGFVELELSVLGPEASLVLEAYRGATRCAERTVRLPVALGEAGLATRASLLADGAAVALTVVLPPGRKQGIVDVFSRGRWSATQAFVAGAGDVALAAEWLAPGLTRIQAHADRFSGDGAGARLVYVRPAGQGSELALREVAAAVRAAGFATLPLDASDAPPTGASPELTAAFLLASLEGQRVPLPRAVSGRPPELARLARGQAILRFGVGALLTLAALVVGLTLTRRGLSAQAEAEGILEGAAEEAGVPRNNEAPHGVLVVVCLGLAVGLAFVLAALLIVAKPLWF